MSPQNFRSIIMKSLLLGMALLMLTACSEQPKKTGIEVSDAWIRKMPPGTMNTAVFFTLNNHTGQPVTLTGVSMEQAKHVMMHETKVVDDMAKMVHLEQVVIEQQVKFEPGAKHIMVMGLDMSDNAPSYNISLHFANNPSLDVAAEVRNAE